MNNWYVITGAPCSGKTTTIRLLSSKGYKTTAEAARAYYESQMELGKTADELRLDPQSLQDGIAKKVIETEENLAPKEIIFLDRGIPDNFSYYEFYNLTPPQFIKDAFETSTYKKVFYMERLPVKKDAVRTESEEEIETLSRLSYEYYACKKVEIVRVPVMGEEERVDFILKHI